MRTYPDRPWVGIGVVVHRGEEILLIKRAKEPNKGIWSLPGGAQHVGETVFDGAAREVLEETAIYIKDPQFIDCVDSIHTDEDGRVKYHYTLIEVSCLYDHGGLKALDDAAAARWVPYSKLGEYDLPAFTQRVIDLSYRSRKASLTEE
ncbi:NUDIX hydrolase [Terasakiella sp. A23]|uniref:NUDIX hydrolase n=1 Tax=Terasakiella sp. FCG-A23 TaxID=3080561 RepID=UPI0029541857|nr:NUDIX hydrolase [Terasakiella sp. A23]MDV7340305.1 NUDIX hydrolase [Terasakiella sp. A23]